MVWCSLRLRQSMKLLPLSIKEYANSLSPQRRVKVTWHWYDSNGEFKQPTQASDFESCEPHPGPTALNVFLGGCGPVDALTLLDFFLPGATPSSLPVSIYSENRRSLLPCLLLRPSELSHAAHAQYCFWDYLSPCHLEGEKALRAVNLSWYLSLTRLIHARVHLPAIHSHYASSVRLVETLCGLPSLT